MGFPKLALPFSQVNINLRRHTCVTRSGSCVSLCSDGELSREEPGMVPRTTGVNCQDLRSGKYTDSARLSRENMSCRATYFRRVTCLSLCGMSLTWSKYGSGLFLLHFSWTVLAILLLSFGELCYLESPLNITLTCYRNKFFGTIEKERQYYEVPGNRIRLDRKFLQNYKRYNVI